MFGLLLTLCLLPTTDRGFRGQSGRFAERRPGRLLFFAQEWPRYDAKGKAALVLMTFGYEAAQRAPLDVKVLLDDFTMRHYDQNTAILYSRPEVRNRIDDRREAGFWRWYFGGRK